MRDLAITAIIPLYNGAEFIEEALTSVLGQILPPKKIIVVDDGSTDNGASIVAEMAKIHDICLIQKANGGQSSARNLGVSRSTTPLIALLDQDDIWYPHHLRELVKPFHEERYPELGWVYSNLDEIDLAGRMVTRSCLDHVPLVVHPKKSLSGCLVTDMFVVPTSTLISRQAFDATGGFDERLIGYEDDDLFLRLFRQGYDNVYIKEPLAKWRIFSGSTSWSPHMRRSRMVYLRKLQELFPPDTSVGTYYWRHLLGPRFYPMLLREYTRSASAANWDAIDSAVEDIRLLLPYAPARARLVMGGLLPIMKNPALARMIVRLAGLNVPMLNRIARW